MGENQGSRYSIMEELNKKKIKVRSELAELERELDKHTFDTNTQIEEGKEEVTHRERTYEAEHNQVIRNLKVNQKLMTQDYDRMNSQIKLKLDTENDNYKQRFSDWKENNLAVIDKSVLNLERHVKTQESIIIEKKEILKEIENGINDLKDMSSEQTKKEK